ncbi:MAG TPA: hypothetical protein VFO16_10620 [Pseudonocardiaceae bacterium]|nr:hypothetical protein [Pseudonocardiaceae bacterium]
MPVAPHAARPAALLATGFIATGLLTGLVAGCGTSGASGQGTVTPAEPAVAPDGGRVPSGTLVPLGAPATEVVVDPRTRTVAVALLGPPRLLLRALDDPASARQIPLPGPATDLVLAAERDELLVPVSTPGCLIRVPLGGGAPSRIDVGGAPRGAVAVGHLTVIALGDQLAVFDGDRARAPIRGFLDAARLVPIGDPAGTTIGVLDRRRSAMSVVDLSSGQISPALRAGDGAADAVADRFGRMLVTDARDGELLAFADNPPMLRQRFPLPGVPYGLAYDSQRDLAWVSLTARDEVVGLAVAAGEPTVVHRFAAVHQPDAVAVDPVSGRVLVVSASGMGLQVIDPERVVK